MALLAEEIVEEWLRREGYFTIRGIKLGVHEIDLLAVRYRSGQAVECRHIEVQASVRPVSYISKVPKLKQREGRSANSAKRSQDELHDGVSEWVNTKYNRPDKVTLRASLWPGKWSTELVINKVKSEDEVKLIESHGVSIIRLLDIVKSLGKQGSPIGCASGGDFVELLHLGADA